MSRHAGGRPRAALACDVEELLRLRAEDAKRWSWAKLAARANVSPATARRIVLEGLSKLVGDAR